jgi:hypothetical protein
VINVAGTQGDYNNYVLDGGSHTDTFTNTNLPFPFPDALREFSVESNSLQARNGLHPGTLVNGVTVSGTNQWHGTAFDFIRNNIINANYFFSAKKTRSSAISSAARWAARSAVTNVLLPRLPGHQQSPGQQCNRLLHPNRL